MDKSCFSGNVLGGGQGGGEERESVCVRFFKGIRLLFGVIKIFWS